MKWQKLLALGMAAIMTAAFVTGCGGGADKANNADKTKKIVVGLDDNFPPMGFKNESNEIVGFDIDLAKEASKRLGREVEFKAIDWSSKEAELKSGRVDILWNGLDITEKRKENMLFSDPYMDNRQIIFVKKGSVLALADNMESTKAGDWSHLTLDVYPDENADAQTVIYEDDCETVAYKDGKFRTTEITLRGADGMQTLTIDPAEGSFDGPRAFTEREYTVRIHKDGLSRVTLNGAEIPFERIGQDETGKPFAVQGASSDGGVCVFSFRAAVGEKSVVVFG